MVKKMLNITIEFLLQPHSFFTIITLGKMPTHPHESNKHLFIKKKLVFCLFIERY